MGLFLFTWLLGSVHIICGVSSICVVNRVCSHNLQARLFLGGYQDLCVVQKKTIVHQYKNIEVVSMLA